MTKRKARRPDRAQQGWSIGVPKTRVEVEIQLWFLQLVAEDLAVADRDPLMHGLARLFEAIRFLMRDDWPSHKLDLATTLLNRCATQIHKQLDSLEISRFPMKRSGVGVAAWFLRAHIEDHLELEFKSATMAGYIEFFRKPWKTPGPFLKPVPGIQFLLPCSPPRRDWESIWREEVECALKADFYVRLPSGHLKRKKRDEWSTSEMHRVATAIVRACARRAGCKSDPFDQERKRGTTRVRIPLKSDFPS